VSAGRFAEVRAEAEQRIKDVTETSNRPAARAAAVVQDAGYTEIAPGSFTVVALQRG
jgi:peptidyl-tRNA hydrolase